jgi:hypothetical protein
MKPLITDINVANTINPFCNKYHLRIGVPDKDCGSGTNETNNINAKPTIKAIVLILPYILADIIFPCSRPIILTASTIISRHTNTTAIQSGITL